MSYLRKGKVVSIRLSLALLLYTSPDQLRADPTSVFKTSTQCAVVSSSKCFVDGEIVSRFKHVGVVARAIDLSLVSLPFWLVDGVDPVLNLHNEAPVLLNYTRSASIIEKSLSLLQSKGTLTLGLDVKTLGSGKDKFTVHSVAGVKLESLLISEDVNLNSAPRASKCCNGTLLSPVVRSELVPIY